MDGTVVILRDANAGQDGNNSSVIIWPRYKAKFVEIVMMAKLEVV
jgi:hypothetical protein